MPYKSSKQKRFFRMCANSPQKAKGKCPPKRVIEEFEKAEKKSRGNKKR